MEFTFEPGAGWVTPSHGPFIFASLEPGIAEVARMQRSQGDADAAQDGAGWAGRSPASGWYANEF